MKKLEKYFLFLMLAALLTVLSGCRNQNETSSEATAVTDMTEDLTEETIAAVTEVTENVTAATAVTDLTASETEEITIDKTADYSGIECCRITEYTIKNNIFFSYPQIDSSYSNSEEINQMIIDYVSSYISPMYNGEFNPELMGNSDKPEMWDYNETINNLEDGGLLLEMDYKIQRMDSIYLSISFEGSFYVKRCAHPNAVLCSLVIDAEKCCIVEMSDLYNVDSEFADVISKNYEEQAEEAFSRRTGLSPDEMSDSLKESLNGDLGHLSTERVLNAFTADDSRGWGFDWFMTDTDIGIVVPTYHAIGDYVVIYISFDEFELL